MPQRRAALNTIVLAGFAAVLTVVLSTLSHTDRARQNVLQGASCLFLLIVAAWLFYGAGISDAGSALRSPSSKALSGAGLNLRLHRFWPALLLGAAVWSPMIPLYFIGDDFEHLSWSRAPFFSSIWALARHGQEGLFLRPLGSATIFLDYRLWHNWPAGYHLTNLAIHLAAVAGLYKVCRELRFGPLVAAVASVIYAVLPIETEAVAWLGARFDLLSACFVIWTAFFYVKFRQQASRTAYFAGLICFGCALLSKENAYLFPATLLATEYLVLPQPRFKPLAPFFLLAAALFSYRWLTLGGVGGYRNSAGQPIAFHAGYKLLQGLFVRDPALLFAGYNWAEPTRATTTILSSLAFATLLALAIAYKPRRGAWKQIAFCLVWVVVPLLPAHPLLLIQPDLTNARILYLSAAGMAMLIAIVLRGVQPVSFQRIGAALLVCLYCLGTLHNIGAWRWATRQEKNLLSELKRLAPSPPPHALFVFYDMPGTIRGVYFLQAGLRDSVRLQFGRSDIDAIRPDQDSSLPEADLRRPVIRLQWTGKEHPLLLAPR